MVYFLHTKDLTEITCLDTADSYTLCAKEHLGRQMDMNQSCLPSYLFSDIETLVGSSLQ